MDNKNPLRHMIVWNCIATISLLIILVILNATTEAARAKIFESAMNFSLGAVFWLVVAIIAGLIGGAVMGMILWFFTFTARVTEKSIMFYYLRTWLSLGILMLLVYGAIAWWYINSGQWAYLPWTDAPYTRDAMLSVLWLISLPLVGATRFIDSLYVDVKQAVPSTKATKKK